MDDMDDMDDMDGMDKSNRQSGDWRSRGWGWSRGAEDAPQATADWTPAFAGMTGFAVGAGGAVMDGMDDMDKMNRQSGDWRSWEGVIA